MIIDSHQHLMLPTSMQIEKMDRAGIAKTILFSTTPHVERAGSLDEIRMELKVLQEILSGACSREERIAAMNTSIAELCAVIQSNPTRFLGFGPLPPSLSRKETASWIDRNILANGLKGVGEITPGTVKQMADLEAAFQTLSGDFASLPLWVHTFHPVTTEGLRILMGLCRKYPDVTVIFGHCGGPNWMEAVAFVKEHDRAYLDLSATFTSLTVRVAMTEAPEKCLFSSDAPFGEPWLYREAIEYLSPGPAVTEMVLGGNIGRLLDL